MAKLKVGIIGCGRISQFHGMPARAQDNVDLVSCCDIVEERAQEKAELFGCDRHYLDYREMLAKESLDAVHICLPHYLHPPVAMEAMEKGIHVLTEKPMSIELDDAKAMIATAESNGVALGVIFQNHYNAGSVLIKNALEHGSLGDVYAAKASVTWFRPDEYYQGSDWKGTWDREGGGVVIDQAIHTLDLMRWFVNDDISFVDAHISNRDHDVITVEDAADGLVVFKNGVRASFWAVNYYSYDAQVEIEMHCENGIVKMTAEEGRVELFDGREFAAKPDPNESFDYGGGPSYWGTSHLKQIQQFYEALANGEAPEIDGREAIKTQEMVCAIYESGKSGKPVHLA